MIRKQQPCTCPWEMSGWGIAHGVESTPVPTGPQLRRVSTTTGCLEHDSCHRWTAKAVRARQRAMKSAIHPWCPIHEAKGCPETWQPTADASSQTRDTPT